jgi:hypothetical protein
VTLRPVVLLCIVIFVNTFSVGAFPVLLPEMGRAGGLSDVSLGIVAAAFGVDARRDRVEQIISTVLDLAEGPVVAAGCQDTGKSADRSGRLITMLGGSIAAVSARPQLPLDRAFATHTSRHSADAASQLRRRRFDEESLTRKALTTFASLDVAPIRVVAC